MAQHYMTRATNTTAVCGTDMVGQRNSRWDSNPAVTSCKACKDTTEWKEAVAWMIEHCKDDFDASRFQFNLMH